jgi:hypothetical protein
MKVVGLTGGAAITTAPLTGVPEASITTPWTSPGGARETAKSALTEPPPSSANGSAKSGLALLEYQTGKYGTASARSNQAPAGTVSV